MRRIGGRGRKMAWKEERGQMSRLYFNFKKQ